MAINKTQLEAYIITNGRSTFEYAKKCLEEQTMKIKINVVRDMPMVDAMNHIIKTSNTRYFLKVDDAFLLHPQSVEFMAKQINHPDPRSGFWFWHLYETWTSSRIQSIKIYDTKKCRKVGGFRAFSSGRVDLPFMNDIKKQGYGIWNDSSMVALHACSSWAEQEEYEKIWAKNSKANKHHKATREKMKLYPHSIQHQYENIDRLLVRNAKKSKFAKYVINSRNK